MDDPIIRLARHGEAERIADIEVGSLPKYRALPDFAERFVGFVARPEKYAPFVEDGRAFVAVDQWDWPMGFSAVDEMDGEAYLAELAVDFDYQGRGLGRRLIAAACDWARICGYRSMLLSTFKDVPWNAPYYARQGFRILAPDEHSKPGIKRQRDHEAEFLDLETRVFMRKAAVARYGTFAFALNHAQSSWQGLTVMTIKHDRKLLRPRLVSSCHSRASGNPA